MTPDPMPRPTEDELLARYHEAVALQGAGPGADLRAAVLAQADGDALGQLGIVRQRQGAITALARAVAGGELSLHIGAPVASTLAALRALPGVGDYTAAAIASFAYGAAEVVLDVNVRRVLARLDGGADAPLGAPTAAERRRAAAWLPERHAAVWSVAAMELGAQVCRSARPDCPACPVATSCRWLAAGRPPGPARPRQLHAGTDRAARGHVLAALRALPTGRSADAATLVGGWPDQAQASAALQSLLSDGLVRTDREGYTL